MSDGDNMNAPFVSSTPIHETENTIVSQDLSMVAASETGNIFSEDSFSAISVSEPTDVEFSSSTVQSVRLQWNGVWKKFIPKNSSSLYYKIFFEEEEIEDALNALLYSYPLEPNQVVSSILQLYMDLSGFSKLKVIEQYNIENSNPEDFVQWLESSFLEYRTHNEYFIFGNFLPIQNAADGALSTFLNRLIVISFKKHLIFDDKFNGHIFGMAVFMSKSHMISLAVTGTIISIKLLTNLLELIHRIEKISAALSCDHVELENLQAQKEKLANMVEVFYKVFETNCILYDEDTCVMRQMCAKEMINWIKLFPKIFIVKRKCLKRLATLISDEDETVRLSALETLQKIFVIIENDEQISRQLMICVNIVSERLFDTNEKVALNVVKTFTEIVKTGKTRFIANEPKLIILYLVFQSNFAISSAAAECLVLFCRKNNKHNEDLLVFLFKMLTSKKEYIERMVYFVEAFYDFCPEFTDCKTILNALELLSVDTRSQFLLMIKESMHRYLTGKFSIKNIQNPRQVISVNAENHRLVASTLLNALNLLVTNNNKEFLQILLNILSFIDYKHCLDLTELCQNFFHIVREIFVKTTDVELLLCTTKLLYLICEKNQTFDNAKDAINSVIDNVTDTLVQIIDSEDSSILNDLRNYSMKSAILFSQFDLRRKLKWETIFFSWKNNLKVLKYMFQCCKWSLVWHLRDVDLYHRDSALKNLNNFTEISLQVINSQNGHNEIKLFIFDNLSDLYCIILSELNRTSNLRKFIKIHTQFHDTWVNFVVSEIITAQGLNLNRRQDSLLKALSVILAGAMPLTQTFSVLLKYYAKYYQDLGDVFNSGLSKLITFHPVLSTIIIHTLVLYFEDIINNFTYQTAKKPLKDLMVLAKKLSTLKNIFPLDMQKIINMGVKYSFDDNRHYPFLSYMVCFIHRLDKDAIKELYEQILPKIGKNAKKHASVKEFLEELRKQ